MKTNGFLGIDIGTQGLSVIFTDTELKILASGEGSYDMVPGLDTDCYLTPHIVGGIRWERPSTELHT